MVREYEPIFSYEFGVYFFTFKSSFRAGNPFYGTAV